jgi:GntR family transcriptional regulator / MocR family aminotransferase
MARALHWLNLDRSKASSLQEQLVVELRRKIQSGVLRPGESLPSTRELAQDLGVSRNTVIAAYDRLLGEGYLESQLRSGIYVSPDLAVRHMKQATVKSPLQALTPVDQETVLRGPSPFRPSQPDVRLFPIALWNRIRNRELRVVGTGILNYQSRFALGLPTLRHALADYLNDNRGVRCDWKQIAITSGSQHALFLLAQLLLKKGDSVWMENPGYRGARFAFELAGAKLRLMEVDEQACVPPKDFGNAKLVYVTPSRQYPTGACMPAARRLAMLKVANSSNAYLIEDDYDSEFRYSRAPLPSLHSLDNQGGVIYLGSMSKVLYPSLRIGYIVLPHELVESFERLRLVVDDHGPLVDQATLAAFISSGAFYTHVRRCRKIYAERLATFLESMEKNCVPLDFPFTDGGMNQTGYFKDSTTNAVAAANQLRQQGLDIPAIQHFSIGRARSGLVFGFTAFEHSIIRSSLATVGKSLTSIKT